MKYILMFTWLLNDGGQTLLTFDSMRDCKQAEQWANQQRYLKVEMSCTEREIEK